MSRDTTWRTAALRALTVGAAAVAALLLVPQSPGAQAPPSDVTKATLPNGLRVVIVRNSLAPVVSTDVAYLVGSRDDPADVPGMAHAQEHMMFRGTKHLSTAELGTIATALGGSFNAETAETLTQFEFTVPAADLDAVLRIESDRMRDILDAQSEWERERGAIEQEVLGDESSPGRDFFSDADRIAYAGTTYAHDGVGTRAAFDRLTGSRLKQFYERWYAPNNAVFVIAGDVDPAATLALVRERFATIPARHVPSHSPARLAPLARTVLRRTTTLAYPLAAIGFRMPGLKSRDFLASFVLQSVLQSDRGPLRALVDGGDAIDSEWISMPYVPEAQLAFATAVPVPGSAPATMAAHLERVLTAYARAGVPPDVFATTKRRVIADQELSRNSIASLASDWATTIALDGEPSIAREEQLLAGVTLADVDRVARVYLDPRHAIVGELTPGPGASQNARAAPPARGPEMPLGAQPPVTSLPSWAAGLVDHVAIPPAQASPAVTKFANGMTLVVQPESISDSVTLFGRIRTVPALQEPEGQEGVSDVLAALFDNGTSTMDRAAFVRAQDELGASVAGGSAFGVQTTSRSFARAVALLAQNERSPRFDRASFTIAQRRAIDALTTAQNGSAYAVERKTVARLFPPGDPRLRAPTIATMRALTLADVRAYYARIARPDRTTIVVVGNVTPRVARSVVEAAFGTWENRGVAPQLDFPPVPLNPPGEIRLSLPTEQDDVSLEQIVPLPDTAPDLYPLELGNAILGGGSLGPDQSRLWRDLRQSAGLVYSIASQLSEERAYARFSIGFASQPENEARIESLIDAEVERLRTRDADPFELALMKASLVRRATVDGASTESIASTLLDEVDRGQPFDQRRIDAKAIVETSADDVRASFAAHVDPRHFLRIIQGP